MSISISHNYGNSSICINSNFKVSNYFGRITVVTENILILHNMLSNITEFRISEEVHSSLSNQFERALRPLFSWTSWSLQKRNSKPDRFFSELNDVPNYRRNAIITAVRWSRFLAGQLGALQQPNDWLSAVLAILFYHRISRSSNNILHTILRHKKGSVLAFLLLCGSLCIPYVQIMSVRPTCRC